MKIAFLAVALSLGSMLAAPLSAGAASDHRVFDGTVVHVSKFNIKVHGVEGGKAQTLSFVIDKQSMMRAVKPGEYVRVVYDQRLLGTRHADSVVPYDNPAMKIKS